MGLNIVINWKGIRCYPRANAIYNSIFYPQVHQREGSGVQRILARRFFASLEQDSVKKNFFHRIMKGPHSADLACEAISDLDDALVFDLLFRVKPSVPLAKMVKVQKRIIAKRGLGWFVSNYSLRWESCYTLKNLKENEVFELSDINEILDYIQESKILFEVFSSFNDFEVVQLFSRGTSLKMARELLISDLRFRKTQALIGPQLLTIQRFIRLFPSTKSFFVTSYLELLDDVDAQRLQFHENNIAGKKGVRFFHNDILVFAASRIASLGVDGVDLRLALLAKRSILRWFGLYYGGEFKERLLRTKLAREVGLKEDGYFHTMNMPKRTVEESTKHAKPFYLALKRLGCIINPYKVESLELSYQTIDPSDSSSLSRFLFFSLGVESVGFKIPERLTFVDSRGICFEVDMIAGEYRTNRDSFVHNDDSFKGAFSLLSDDDAADMENSFGSLLFRRADFSTLPYLSYLTGLSVQDIKLSTLSYDIYRNRVKQLLAWAGSSVNKLRLIYSFMEGMRENGAFVSSLHGMEKDFSVFSVLGSSVSLLTQPGK